MTQPRILVADDSEVIREVLTAFLDNLGYRVDTAADGQAALDAFRSQRHDLLITDLQMPRLEGLPLLKLVKAVEPDVAVIILTGHATLETAVEALRLGAYDYLLKPIEDMEAFGRLVARALKHHALVNENKRLLDELRQANSRLGAEVAERTRELQAAYESLRSLDKLKNDFVSVVSHELRTPLTSMRGSLGLLQGGVVGELSEEAQGLVGIAMQNCERLVRLVTDLLDLEKITAGHGAFRIALLDWPAVVRQAIDSSRGFVQSYGVDFELEAPAALRVRGDEDRLIQVLSNLLFNAAKFSPRGSVVTVSTRLLADSWVRTSVRDRGPGIPEHFRERIFQRFAQADMGEDRPAEGSGLGLAISREIVEHLGGRIGFDAAQGAGTVFWFDLPGASESSTQ